VDAVSIFAHALLGACAERVLDTIVPAVARVLIHKDDDRCRLLLDLRRDEAIGIRRRSRSRGLHVEGNLHGSRLDDRRVLARRSEVAARPKAGADLPGLHSLRDDWTSRLNGALISDNLRESRARSGFRRRHAHLAECLRQNIRRKARSDVHLGLLREILERIQNRVVLCLPDIGHRDRLGRLLGFRDRLRLHGNIPPNEGHVVHLDDRENRVGHLEICLRVER